MYVRDKNLKIMSTPHTVNNNRTCLGSLETEIRGTDIKGDVKNLLKPAKEFVKMLEVINMDSISRSSCASVKGYSRYSNLNACKRELKEVKGSWSANRRY